MKPVCKEEKCTACGACQAVCPKKCIFEQMKDDDSWYMGIDEEQCIKCNLCKCVCPNEKFPELYTPQKSFAAWAFSDEIHRNAASGGVVSSIYEYAVFQNMYFAGVKLNNKFEAKYEISNDISAIAEYRNSKYTFSHMGNIYQEVEKVLAYGSDVIFVGLPCQVAAMRNYIDMKEHTGTMYTIDLVCHGTPPPIYLQQHIEYIAGKIGKMPQKCFFRDAKFNTSNYAYTLYMHNSEKPIYKKYVNEDDTYQIGYHKALIYQEVCYRCKYAQRNRAGDLTLGDYSGLGSMAPYKHKRKKVSCLIINTEKGKHLIDKLQDENILCLHERPLVEPMEGIAQFNHPLSKGAEYEKFKNSYKDKKNFDKAAEEAFRRLIKVNKIKMFFHCREVKKICTKILPQGIKDKIRKYYD